jgi:transcription antitermination factor NusG
MLDQHWYVARLKAGNSRTAIHELTKQGFENYYPQMRTTRILHGGRVINATEPVFPNYLFLKSLANAACWRAIYTTRGVIKLLGNSCPCPLLDREVEQLQQRERAGLLSHGGKRQIRQGDLVEFKCGSFLGLQGICQWTRRERIGVLLSFLGGDTVVTSSRDLLKLAVA